MFLNKRVWLNLFNGNLIISGAFGLFRKDAVISVGGYDTKSIGEDMDLVLKLHSFYRQNQIPYQISYEPYAVCWSQVPSKLKDLKNQRRRWQIGLMTSMFNHRQMALNPQYGLTGFFSFTYLRARIKLILFSLIENFGYRQLISLYRFSALIGYRKHKHQWKKISRVKHNKLH